VDSTPIPIRVGASACLLGDEVRWDGTARLDPWLRDVLGRQVELVPVCPEIEVGMGVPREPVDLVRIGGGDRMIARSSRDWTAPMEAFAARRIAALPPLDGYAFKARSPSCGLGSTPLRGGRGRTAGLFAAAFATTRPFTPCVEETALAAPGGRAAFVERVFAAARLRSLLAGRFSAGRLVAFHAAEKYRLLAHAPARYRALGRLVARASSLPAAEARDAYAAGFTAALATPPTPGRLVDAMTHALGHLKRTASPPERASAAAAIAGFGRAEAPLAEPLSVLRHLVRVHGEPYLAGQALLFPDPREWSLRFGP
jgi:uncharacterized protein YbgA (DUF1722 family)/uncharacterized protein YbbK (DUF523 family)